MHIVEYEHTSQLLLIFIFTDANIFIHFEPTGWPLIRRADDPEPDTDLPPYILRGSLEEEHWRRYNPGGWKNVRNSEFRLCRELCTMLNMLELTGSFLD